MTYAAAAVEALGVMSVSRRGSDNDARSSDIDVNHHADSKCSRGGGIQTKRGYKGAIKYLSLSRKRRRHQAAAPYSQP